MSDEDKLERIRQCYQAHDLPAVEVDKKLWERFRKKSPDELWIVASEQMNKLVKEKIYDNDGRMAYFEQGNTETMADYVLHLIAGKDKTKADIKIKRVLGLFLVKDTVEKPLIVTRQKSGRIRYNQVYAVNGTKFSHSVIVGVETGQVGRIITSIVAMDEKDDKHASSRDVRKAVERAAEILVVNC